MNPVCGNPPTGVAAFAPFGVVVGDGAAECWGPGEGCEAPGGSGRDALSRCRVFIGNFVLRKEE